MSRKFLIALALFIGFFQAGYGCTCSMLTTISTDFQKSDFVATVKIIKNYKNYPDTNEYYTADIEILNLYKGKKMKSLHILGSNGNQTYNSCGTYIKEGEIRLIFGNLNKANQISTFLCTSHHQPLQTYYKRDFIAEKLNLLKKHASSYVLKVKNDIAFYPYDFQQIKAPQSINHYSLIAILFDKSKKIKKINYLTKENEQLKHLYKAYFNNVDWEDRLKNRVILKDNEEVNLVFEIKPFKN